MNVICFESCVLYSSSAILCCVGGSFPWPFMGIRFPKWIVSFLFGQPVFRRGEKRQLCLQLIRAVRNSGIVLGKGER